jgi:putative NADPH-quinone reductase
MRSLVVYCHPDPASFTAVTRDRAISALQARGDEVRANDLYAEGFDPLFTADERERHLERGSDPVIAPYVEDLLWCERLLLVYPTWWSGQPAMLKGWIERVWVNGVAWELPAGANRLRGRLHNVRRLVAITSHGSSKLINALEGEVGKRMVTRTLRSLCHPLTRTTWLAFYGIDTAPEEQRQRFLAKVERRLS